MTAALGTTPCDLFSEELKEYLFATENFGLEKCSPAFLKKIAHLKSLILENTKFASSLTPVRLFKLKNEIEHLVKDVTKKQEDLIKDCVCLYEQAKIAPLPFIIGDASLRESVSTLINFGILSTDKHSIGKSLDISNTKTGSVFCPSPWSLTRNDSFMLGATRSDHIFYVAKRSIMVDNLWNIDSHTMTTLGREICILHFSGYIQVHPEEKIADYGYMFVKSTKLKDLSPSISELELSISKIKDPKTILGFFDVIKES